MSIVKDNKILMVATFRHFFIGLGLAIEDKSSNYHLIFINQDFDDDRNPIFRAISRLIRPFSSVTCLPLNVAGVFKKYRNRKLIFRILDDIVNELKPVEIATGNDRRIEYQYAMHVARNKLKLNVKGAYLDNGIGSYVNFHKLEFRKYLARRCLDIPLKKLVYGNWYTRMRRYGGSDWTDICYLTHPKYAPSRLAKKECRRVDVNIYKHDTENIIENLLVELGLSSTNLDSSESILLVLPKKPAMELIYGSIEKAELVIKDICMGYSNIYVKYHPEDLGDVLNLSKQATLLPSQVPVELLFINMSFDSVIGDGSTAIMSAKWMLPQASVGFFDLDTPYTALVKGIFIDSGIRPIQID